MAKRMSATQTINKRTNSVKLCLSQTDPHEIRLADRINFSIIKYASKIYWNGADGDEAALHELCCR